MALQPLFARVLLEREKMQSASIIIPEAAAQRLASLKCTVVALGPTADGVEVGDTVLIGRYAGDWLDERGRPDEEGRFFIVQDEDILAKVV